MKVYYFDFPYKHHLSAYYCEVIAESPSIAEAAITAYFGFLISNWYDVGDGFKKTYYKKGCYASIKQRKDENSNRLN